MKSISTGHSLSDRLSSLLLVRIIQRSLLVLLPVLMIGSFSLVVKSFPLEAYQQFLLSGFGSVLLTLADMLYKATFGMLSSYMAVSIGYCMATEVTNGTYHIFGAVLTSLTCFFIMIGRFSSDFNSAYMGVNGMFMALLTSLTASALYNRLIPRHNALLFGYTDGANYTYNSAITSILPMCGIFLLYALVQYGITAIFHVTCAQELFVLGINSLFGAISSRFLQGLLFVLLSSTLWFFGIHGSDILNTVSEGLFSFYMAENVQAVSSGSTATNILSKTFIDVFVLMGGCGSALCLLIALFIFSRQKTNRRLARTACLPMLFNINEIMVFGLPIIFRPVMLIPFLLTPLVNFLISYAAVAVGLVPVAAQTVEWTTPVLFSGYLATGSLAGTILQVLNLGVGVAIYAPFVKRMEREQCTRNANNLQHLVETFRKAEETNTPLRLDRLPGELSSVVKMLTLDLRHAMRDNRLSIAYQPQFDKDMRCIGAEALLRWTHPSFGDIYPPLVIRLASEDDRLFELESFVLRTASADFPALSAAAGGDFVLSVNITAESLQADSFSALLENINADGLCLEITEQSALQLNKQMTELLRKLHERGFRLAIDDFSMGHTSIRYLQDNRFDLVKLDGSLVRGLDDNERCRDIVRSITYLASSLHFSVLAEFVETQKQMEDLMASGCFLYQGWLYSPALPKEKLIPFLTEGQHHRS